MFLPDKVKMYQLRAKSRGGVSKSILIPISANCRFNITPSIAGVVLDYEEGEELDIYQILQDEGQLQFLTSDETDCKITDILIYDSLEATESLRTVKIDALTLKMNSES